MKDIFAVLEQEISELKKEHTGYIDTLPRLKIAKEQAIQDLEEVNKQLIDALAKLDDANDELKGTRTIIENEKANHKQKMSQERAEFESWKDSEEQSFASKRSDQGDIQEELNKVERRLNEHDSALQAREKVCVTEEKRLREWQETLQTQEDNNHQAESENGALETILTTKQTDLEARETNTVNIETMTVEALKRAENTEKQVNDLMLKAKTKLVEVESRENGLIKREIALQAQKSALEKREIRLVDREKIQRSNLGS